jgi:cysteine synthase A
MVSRALPRRALIAGTGPSAIARAARIDGVGHTPLVELRRLSAGLPARIAVKLESRNPTGSVKDRVAEALVADAEEQGRLHAGCTLVMATSGNTGLALARVAAIRGYRVRLAVPAHWSHERLALLLYMGADVAIADGDMRAAVARALQILAQTPDAVHLDQFTAPANVDIHRRTTAEEIWRDTGGQVAAFVCGVGSGGTLTGVALGLRGRRPDLHVVAVEPSASPVLSGGKAGAHGIQGIGAGFVPPLLQRELVSEITTVSDGDAYEWARRLARQEGILGGVSSGANIAAAMALARRKSMAGKLIVTVVSDSAERYVIAPPSDVRNSRGTRS